MKPLNRIARRELVAQLYEYGIRGPSDYAEILVAEAVRGKRMVNNANQGYDLTSPSFGRIEVKCRRLPADGRIEERVNLGDTKTGGFDHLAILIFYPDFNVKGAVLVPYEQVWPIINDRKFRRITFARACKLPGAVDITTKVVRASRR